MLIIYFWERQSASRGRSRERETQDPKQAPGSELSAQSLTLGSSPTKLWDHDLSQSGTLNQLSHTGAPEDGILNVKQQVLGSQFEGKESKHQKTLK